MPRSRNNGTAVTPREVRRERRHRGRERRIDRSGRQRHPVAVGSHHQPRDLETCNARTTRLSAAHPDRRQRRRTRSLRGRPREQRQPDRALSRLAGHAFTWRHQVPALAAAGYHVIVPNQRGYWDSSRPTDVAAYDIEHLSGDLVVLLDHYGYDKAVFVGHDWGANVVWGTTCCTHRAVDKVIAVEHALPGARRSALGRDDGTDPRRRLLLRPLQQPPRCRRRRARRVHRAIPPQHVPKERAARPLELSMINVARAEHPAGEPIMGDDELAVFVSAFESSGFTGSINWYRNLDRNWHLLADADPVIQQPALMIYGDRDAIPKSPNLTTFVPNADEISLDCGHWIQEEKPEETTQAILDWLGR